MALTPKRLLLAAAGCVVGFVVLLTYAYDVWLTRWIDAAALQGFRGLQRPAVFELTYPIARLADPLPFLLAGGCLVLLALAQHRRGHAVAIGVAMLGASLTTQILKPLLAVPRTQEFLGGAQIETAAFPSGHATAAMSLALAAVVVSPPRLRALVGCVGALFAVAVSLSSVSLGWHFPSDVVGGYLVAAAWTLAALAGLRASAGRPDAVEVMNWRGPLASLAVGLAAAGAVATLLVAPRLPEAIDYAQRHTAAVVVGVLVAFAAAVIVAALTAASSVTRRV